MISSMVVFVIGLILDAIASTLFSFDFLLIQPGFVTFFAFSFWVLVNLRLSVKNQLIFTLFVGVVFELINYNTYWMYLFVLILLWPIFNWFSKVLRQSYLDQYIFVNIMTLLWLLFQYGYMKLFSLTHLSFQTFFFKRGFLTLLVQLLFSLIVVFVMRRYDRWVLQKDMERRRQEYVFFRE